MTNILVVDGGTIFRRYVQEVRKQNKLLGICKKTVKTKNNEGDVIWKKDYYYKKVARSESEKALLLDKGYSPSSSYVRYSEDYLGPERPDGFEDDELSEMKSDGLVSLQGRNMITTPAVFEDLKNRYPDFRALQVFQVQ